MQTLAQWPMTSCLRSHVSPMITPGQYVGVGTVSRARARWIHERCRQEAFQSRSLDSDRCDEARGDHRSQSRREDKWDVKRAGCQETGFVSAPHQTSAPASRVSPLFITVTKYRKIVIANQNQGIMLTTSPFRILTSSFSNFLHSAHHYISVPLCSGKLTELTLNSFITFMKMLTLMLLRNL